MFLTKPGDDVAASPPPSKPPPHSGVLDVLRRDAGAARARFNLGAQEGVLKHICWL